MKLGKLKREKFDQDTFAANTAGDKPDAIYSDTSSDNASLSDFDDTGIITDIPGDSSLSSNGAMRLWEPQGLTGEIGAPRTDLNEQM